MLPPRAKGTITHIAPKGQYTLKVSRLHYIFIVNGQLTLFTLLGRYPGDRVRGPQGKVHPPSGLARPVAPSRL